MKAPITPAAHGRIPRQWQWHHRALLVLRDHLLRERDEHHAAIRVPKDEGDAGDVAAFETDRDELLAEISVEEAELAEVEAALGRLQAGTYGVCAVTGNPIPAARLRAVPWTRFSVDVAMQLEAGRHKGPAKADLLPFLGEQTP